MLQIVSAPVRCDRTAVCSAEILTNCQATGAAQKMNLISVWGIISVVCMEQRASGQTLYRVYLDKRGFNYREKSGDYRDTRQSDVSPNDTAASSKLITVDNDSWKLITAGFCIEQTVSKSHVSRECLHAHNRTHRYCFT